MPFIFVSSLASPYPPLSAFTPGPLTSLFQSVWLHRLCPRSVSPEAERGDTATFLSITQTRCTVPSQSGAGQGGAVVSDAGQGGAVVSGAGQGGAVVSSAGQGGAVVSGAGQGGAVVSLVQDREVL